VSTIAILLLVAVGGAIGYNYFARDEAVELRSPDATTQPAPPPASQAAKPAIMLENVRVELVAGARAVIVRGSIVNVGAATVKPLRIRFTFKNNDRQSIGEAAYDLKQGPIGRFGRQDFEQWVDDPPEGAVEVVVAVEALD
jgi:hypothetical protein